MTQAEALARAEEIRMMPGEITSGQRAAYAFDLYDYMEGLEPERQNWRTDGEKKAAALAERIGASYDSVLRVRRIIQKDLGAREKLETGEWDIVTAGRNVGLQMGRSGIKATPRGNGTVSTISRGDQWDAALHDAYLYLSHRETLGMKFPHVAPREAARRVREIDELLDLLNQARADLAPRAVRAQTTSG